MYVLIPIGAPWLQSERAQVPADTLELNLNIEFEGDVRHRF